MTKRFTLTLVVVIALLVPSLVLAASSTDFTVAKAQAKTDNVVVVPLTVSNDKELAALDIPLKFSEGVTLKEVDFEGTRVEYFDLKAAMIDNENQTVVIGLLPQISPVEKPYLEAGDGVVANLVFEINDASLEELTLEAVELKAPDHRLSFVYRDGEAGTSQIKVDRPEFGQTVVALNGTENGLPISFGLHQNYPNPFNPSTQIAFDLPSASHVELSIYNVLGQEVKTLINQQMEAGSHVVTFDGSNLASGIYFYRISADNFSDTKKMMMLK